MIVPDTCRMPERASAYLGIYLLAREGERLRERITLDKESPVAATKIGVLREDDGTFSIVMDRNDKRYHLLTNCGSHAFALCILDGWVAANKAIVGTQGASTPPPPPATKSSN